jgi:hypothetical protein
MAQASHAAPRPRNTLLKVLGTAVLGAAAVAAGAHFWQGGGRPLLAGRYSRALRPHHRFARFALWPSSRPSSRPIFR